MTKFLELSKKYEELKEQMKVVSEELNQEMLNLGVGSHFQDPETKLVYEIVKPTGTYIDYKEIGYNRTKKPEESKGSMSKTRAVELGYMVK